MCRWAAYKGPSIFLEEVIASPRQSLIAQSLLALRGRTPTNGDGFGVAWYGEKPEPGVFRDAGPAWSDENLRNLAGQVRSPLFLAHVRAATCGGSSRANCHPFVSGRWSFMHNGQIEDFAWLRRALEVALPDSHYAQRRGSTDSELMFLLALGFGLENDPQGALERMVGFIEETARGIGARPCVKMTLALSDGRTLHIARYATDGEAPTLFHRLSRRLGGRAVASEPLDSEETDWEEVPQGVFGRADVEGVTLSPFRPRWAPASAAPLRAAR
ncbi:class II glutamine amidotransferase [Neomegalonema sp.]|uniref:class II glutamine amidotransferase n=1 Tax=Neomegalonema sp. TaxID=2039713 RepID=UPI002639BE27|nr:class II glutamine amidotransferase [Neomegalonema sp.]MDD2867126.1 class II glutamine amidotransferase [Neomegalonema sp.]